MARPFLSFTFALAAATLILFGAGATPAPAQAPTPTAPTAASQAKKYPEVDEAIQCLNRRDLAGAVKALDKAARMYPEIPSAHVYLFQIFAKLNQPNAARFQLEEAVKANPSDPEPFVILGSIALQERRVAEATMDFDRAKELLAKYTNTARKPAIEQQAMSGIAQVAESREDWKEAESRLREYLKAAPEDLVGHQRLARALFWQTKAGEAYETLKKAKEIANTKKTSFLTPEAIMGKFYDEYEGQKSTTGNAEKWFKAALKMAPKDLATQQIVALWALEKGKIDFAKELAESALKIEQSDATKYAGSNVGHILRGVVALWEKDWLEAEKNFQAVIYDSPTDFAARNNIALALVEQSDQAKKNKALTYAEENRKDNKDSPEAMSTLGWVRFKRGEFQEAGFALDQAIKASGGNLNSDTATYVAYILYHQDQKWRAKEFLENVLKSDRPFSMRPEAKELFEKVKDATKPADATAVATPPPGAKTP